MQFDKKPSRSEKSKLQVFDLLSEAGVPTPTIERLIDKASELEKLLMSTIEVAMKEIDKNPSRHERLFLKSAFIGGLGTFAESKAAACAVGLTTSLSALATGA